jgi:replicative DNA helicase
MFERLPPQNVEAEMAVLGAMLIGGRAAIERATEQLQKDDFYRDAHGRIFEGMVALAEKDEPVDLVTLRDELGQRNQLEAVGGMLYLAQLADAVPTAANLLYYARIVTEKSVLRRLIEAASEIAGSAYGQVDEVDTLVDQAERAIFNVARRRNSDGFKPLRPLLSEAFENIDQVYHEKGITSGIDTGFSDLNMMTAGFQRGELVIIAARPSMGKTALTLNIGQNAASNGNTVAVFSLEMGKESLVQRMMCSEARVDANKLRTGYLQDEDWSKIADAVQRLWDCQLFIDDTTDMSALEMRAKCRRLKAEYGLDLVIVDYLQLMRGSSKNSENRNQEITEIARGLKNIARELDVPVIALSQLSRSVERREDKRPMLSDLRESGSIEAEADVVAFIYRPAYYARKETYSEGGARRDGSDQNSDSESGGQNSGDGEEAEIIISKQRNGPTGTVKLTFLPKYTRFENMMHNSSDF